MHVVLVTGHCFGFLLRSATANKEHGLPAWPDLLSEEVHWHQRMPSKNRRKHGLPACLDTVNEKMPVALDPLQEEDARRFVELFRDERSYTLQKDRMHEGVEVIKKRYDLQAADVKPKISRLVSFAKKLQHDSGRAFVEVIQAVADILEQFTLNTVSFAMEAVDYMAEYIECKTENYHRLLVVLSQEVQDHMDTYKAVQTTNSFSCRELHARVSLLEDQVHDLKAEVLTVKAELLTVKLRDMRDMLQNRQDGLLSASATLGPRIASHTSGRSTPSQSSSVASSYHESMHRQVLARNMNNVPVMIREAQLQAQLFRRESWTLSTDSRLQF